jgi:hypothetical protein
MFLTEGCYEGSTYCMCGRSLIIVVSGQLHTYGPWPAARNAMLSLNRFRAFETWCALGVNRQQIFISCISASHKMWDTGSKPGFPKLQICRKGCLYLETWRQWASAASDARGRRVSLQFGIQFLFCWQNNNGSVGPQIDGIPLSRPKRNISRDFSDAGTFC